MIVKAATVLGLLPVESRRRVHDLVTECSAILGDALVSILVYGSAVRGGLTPHSDVDILIVLNRDDHELLVQLKDTLAVARAAARVDCRLLHIDEIDAAADVFPTLFDDIRLTHAVLYGTDPFAGLVIHDEHRRLRIEQELRDVRIRLRRLVADASADDSQLEEGLDRKIKAIRSPLHSMLVLEKQEQQKDDIRSVFDSIAVLLNMDITPLFTHIRAAEGAACLRLVLDKAIARVDSWKSAERDRINRSDAA